MEESKRYVRLGLFVAVSVFVVAVVLLLLGGRKWFQPTFTFETYFDKSVAGLEIGAPVRFRGVPLGHVTEILTSAATYERDAPIQARRDYVIVRVEVNLSASEVAQIRKDATALAQKGLRAQTQLAGITGQQYLALDFMDPHKYQPLPFQWTPKYTYLPSAPSSAGEIIAKTQAFLASLNEADIKELGQNLNALVRDLDGKLNELPVAELAARVNGVLGSADVTLRHIDGILAAAPLDHTLRNLDSASGRLDALLGDPALKEAADNLAVTTSRLDGMLGDNQYDVRTIVQNLRAASDDLRALSEAVKRYPAGVLVAGPPAKVPLPGSSR
jgi:ABC-type transporter Mla subunit MlaD